MYIARHSAEPLCAIPTIVISFIVHGDWNPGNMFRRHFPNVTRMFNDVGTLYVSAADAGPA